MSCALLLVEPKVVKKEMRFAGRYTGVGYSLLLVEPEGYNEERKGRGKEWKRPCN